jgi:hypothetical protein
MCDGSAPLDVRRLSVAARMIAVEVKSDMDGWHSVEDLVRYGFTQARVVMANEAHNGLTRCVRTREFGARMVRAAHDAGVRRMAMEALPSPADGTFGPIRAIPAGAGGYLAQPDMRELIGTALELGWTLWAYEAPVPRGAGPAWLRSRATASQREQAQAQNLCRVLAEAPAEALFVWCGNGHASRLVIGESVPMGYHFTALSGNAAFVIDQDVTVEFSGISEPWVPELIASISDRLDALGGTAGILREQAPLPLSVLTGVDAVVVSTDNTLS